jgi:Calx-beta domain
MKTRPAFVLVVCLLLPLPCAAAEWFVALGATGSGTTASPFGSIQDALNAAKPGDVVTVRPGTYPQRVASVRAGTASAPITLRAEGARGSVILTLAGEVMQIDHPYVVVERLVLDGQYSYAIILDINTPANYFVFRDSEVRRAGRDCVDMGSPTGVLFDGALIHHCLNPRDGRTDAHGIAAGAVRNFTIRNTEIHTFSGDAVQLDPARRAPGWDLVTIEGCRFWLEPLPVKTHGFAAGVVPGENAIDTKTYAAGARSRLVIRNTVAWGFRGGLVGNMAAFNLKEKVDVLLDGVTVTKSEIAFRTRGPGANGGAWVRLQNGLVYDVTRAIRYEDNIERLEVFNTTIGLGVGSAFQAASSGMTGLDVRNVLIAGSSLPPEASAPSNLAVSSASFVAAASGDYHLRDGAIPIDQGDTIDGVLTDRDGASRPRGAAYDVGAYEFAGGSTSRPEITIGNVSVTEPATTSNAVFAVRLSAPSSRVVTVDWATRARSATSGVDFVAAGGTLTFAPGQVLGEVRVTVLGDRLYEGTERFNVILSHPIEATITDGTGRASIIDDDLPALAAMTPRQTVQEGTSTARRH